MTSFLDNPRRKEVVIGNSCDNIIYVVWGEPLEGDNKSKRYFQIFRERNQDGWRRRFWNGEGGKTWILYYHIWPYLNAKKLTFWKFLKFKPLACFWQFDKISISERFNKLKFVCHCSVLSKVLPRKHFGPGGIGFLTSSCELINYF